MNWLFIVQRQEHRCGGALYKTFVVVIIIIIIIIIIIGSSSGSIV